MEIVNNQKAFYIQLLGAAFFGFMAFLSLHFYKERMLCFDPAYFSFQIIEYKNYFVALGRWGAVFSQVIPLIALKKGCTLETFLQLYSVSFIIVYYLIFLIITLRLKNYKAAIALLLTLCLAFRHTFYYSTAELYHGLALTILLWAIISPEKEYKTTGKKIVALLFSLVLIYVISYFHQLTLFAAAFIFAVEILRHKRYTDWLIITVLVFLVAWFAVRMIYLTNTSYENNKIISIKTFMEQLPRLKYLPSYWYIKVFIKQHFWTLGLVFFISWIQLLSRKQWLMFLFLPLYSLGFLLLVIITFYRGEAPIMYENYLTLLGLFAAVIFMSLNYERLEKGWVKFLIGFLILINFNGIYNAHWANTKHVDYINRLAQYGRTFEKRKFLINTVNFPWHYAWSTWSFPFETALGSALQSPDSAVTFFVTPDMNKYDTLINKEGVFLGPEWCVTWFGVQRMNKKYYRFPLTGYQKLNTLQTDSSFSFFDLSWGNVFLKPLKAEIVSDKDSFVVVPIMVTNKGKRKIPSTINDSCKATFLSYHIYDRNYTQLIRDGVRNILDVDILPNKSFTQGLTVALPKKKGNYIVEVDLVTEGTRWWNINSKFNLKVK